MQSIENQIIAWGLKQNEAPLRVQTLGGFEVMLDGDYLSPKAWGREKSLQLFQFFVTMRHRKALHKEQILDRLWEEDGDRGDQTFKVALHGLNKALEPERKSHAEARYISRQGICYQLNNRDIWIDADALEGLIALGNQALTVSPELAKTAYRAAIALHRGPYLPDRIYEDWSCDERERLQVLLLGTFVTLAGLCLQDAPMESIRLCQQALLLDVAWEDAYRIQMEAYFLQGNRPLAMRTYQHCAKVLEDEMGILPLPETQRLFQKIKSA
jgi:two-component SAPR family response regulator